MKSVKIMADKLHKSEIAELFGWASIVPVKVNHF